LSGLVFITSCKKNDAPATKLQVLSFSPASAGVGASITVKGSRFDTSPAGNVVKINGKPATVTAATSSSLRVQVPLLAGNGKISVDVGSASASSAQNFTYVYTVSTVEGNGANDFAEGPGALAASRWILRGSSM